VAPERSRRLAASRMLAPCSSQGQALAKAGGSEPNGVTRWRGIQIPPMMLFREGRPNEDLLALFAENVRNPNQPACSLGDG
jgi:hypothetical protein